MATQIVMDHTGDSRHSFDPSDDKAVNEAEFRFQELLRQGYTAATRNAVGSASIVRVFDPNAEQTLFYPRLQGG